MKDVLCESCLYGIKEAMEKPCERCEPDEKGGRSCFESVRAHTGTAYMDQRVQCPFWSWARPKYRLITCEGLITKTQTNVFRSTDETRAYITKYCENDYRRCKLYQLIEKKYETGG